MTSTPHRAATQLGFWSSVSIAALFVIFAICFVAIAATQPLFRWTNLADYAAYAATRDQFIQNLARLTMLLFGPAYVILLACLHDRAPEERRLWTRLALSFGIIFAALTGVHYFVQLSAVRLALAHGDLQGLDQIVQANPSSAFSAINMLGWTLFLGLSSLFLAQVFTPSPFRGREGEGVGAPPAPDKADASSGRLRSAIKIAFLLNSIFCLLGGIGYLLDITVLVFITINFGMGGAVLVASILLSYLLSTRVPSSETHQ